MATKPEGIPQTYTYLGPSPEQEALDWADSLISERGKKRGGFLEYVDTAPNLNGEYKKEIDLVKAQFARDGVKIAPIVVLDKKHFMEACAINGSRISDKNYGKFLNGRSLVQAEPRPGIKEEFGGDYVLGVAMHESAHSTDPDTRDVLTSKRVVEEVETALGDTALQANRYFEAATGFSGFLKYKWEGSKMRGVGNYWDEAFCDLRRVRSLERIGREPKADGKDLVFEERGVRYVGEGIEAPIIDKESDLVNVPIKFSLAAHAGEDGEPHVLFGEPGIAAYGLDLLDKRVPGLFEAMQASRKNPGQQREVIKMINSVHPDLYRRLRDLPYSDKGFGEGLEVVAQALGVES
jgi:hypothetical protein